MSETTVFRLGNRLGLVFALLRPSAGNRVIGARPQIDEYLLDVAFALIHCVSRSSSQTPARAPTRATRLRRLAGRIIPDLGVDPRSGTERAERPLGFRAAQTP